MVNTKRDKRYYNKFLKDIQEGKLQAPICFYAKIDGKYEVINNVSFNCLKKTFDKESDALAYCNKENKI